MPEKLHFMSIELLKLQMEAAQRQLGDETQLVLSKKRQGPGPKPEGKCWRNSQ